MSSAHTGRDPRSASHEPSERTVALSAARGNRGRASLLPGRPPDDVSWAGPPSPASTRPPTPTRAICCSGGGIRAAAFTLGALQTLNARRDGDGTVYSKTHFVTSVSGGGYTAGSYALVKHHLDAGPTRVYAPGSPEDNRLRAHTRYLVDSKTQLTISVMGIIYGLVVNLLAILAVVCVAATLDGLVIGRHALNVLRYDASSATFSAHITKLVTWPILAALIAGCLVYVVYRIWEIFRPFGEVGTTRWCFVSIVLIGLGLAALVLLVGVPALLGVLDHAPSKVAHGPTRVQTGTFLGTVVALVGIVQQLIRSYVPSAKAASSNPVSAEVVKRTGSFAAKLSSRVLPWLGSILIVALLAAAFLDAVSHVAGSPHHDQAWFRGLGGGSLLLLLVWKLLADGNRTSLHRPYTQRLASAFGVTRDGADATDRLSSLATDRDNPKLVICAAVNTDQPGSTPTGRQCAPFTFSAFSAGISSGTMFGRPNEKAFDLEARETSGPDRVDWNSGYARSTMATTQTAHEPRLWMRTDHFEDYANSLTVMDMVAVSGAAVSPAMGRMSRPSLRLLLGVANVRLGMWLPNPLHLRRVKPPSTGVRQWIWGRLRQPGLGSLAKEIVGGLSLKGRWVYVTDGGHYENLGLVEALRRGATDIIVLDASGDKPFTLATFGLAVETARADLGVEITLESEALSEVGKTGVAAGLAARATARYANGVVATIYVCKAAMIAGLPQDLVGWHDSHADFPNTTTGDQFYGDREFEAYRKLGSIAAEQACELRDADLGNRRSDGGTRQFAARTLPEPLPSVDRVWSLWRKPRRSRL